MAGKSLEETSTATDGAAIICFIFNQFSYMYLIAEVFFHYFHIEYLSSIYTNKVYLNFSESM